MTSGLPDLNAIRERAEYVLTHPSEVNPLDFPTVAADVLTLRSALTQTDEALGRTLDRGAEARRKLAAAVAEAARLREALKEILGLQRLDNAEAAIARTALSKVRGVGAPVDGESLAARDGSEQCEEGAILGSCAPCSGEALTEDELEEIDVMHRNGWGIDEARWELIARRGEATTDKDVPGVTGAALAVSAEEGAA